MSLSRSWEILPEEITPKASYLNRRQILKAIGFGGAALLGGEVLARLAFPSVEVQAGTKLSLIHI